MRGILISVAAVVALSAMPPVATEAGAFGVRSAPAIREAVATTRLMEDVRRVCRHRTWTSRRVCFWKPGRHR
jgi:transketolase C-terminal domain/subunit